MKRHEAIKEITQRLEHLDTDALEGLLRFLEGVDRPLSAAGVPYTGDPETDAVLDEHPDILERVRRLEAGEEGLTPIEEIAAKYNVKL